jgi:hypothetical protein
MFHHYGISPWEIEVIFDTLSRSFEVEEKQRQPDDPAYVSAIEIGFPLPYDEDFFRTFTMESWFKIKGVIKDIKRRRGGKGLKTLLRFAGTPDISFQLIHRGDRHFEMAVEKMEYLVDVVPVQIKSVPGGTVEVLFNFDEATYKWHPAVARTKDERNYILKNGEWKTR